MDLNKFLQNEQAEGNEGRERLSKEEYAAAKKQEREEIWAQIDGTTQDIFKSEASFKGFLDFMAQCSPQKTSNLLLLYSQNPDIREVKTFQKWKEEGGIIKKGEEGYRFLADQKYEKNGIPMNGTVICNAYDISQVRIRRSYQSQPKEMDELMAALLTKPPVPIQIADNLPDKLQAQYVPEQWTVYVKNGMSETATFHAINRELSCAALDRHNGSYNRNKVSAQAFCAAYVVAQKYGIDTSGFRFAKVCEYQQYGEKDPRELRDFVTNIRDAAYSINKHMERNLKGQVQEIPMEAFQIADGKETAKPEKKQPER